MENEPAAPGGAGGILRWEIAVLIGLLLVSIALGYSAHRAGVSEIKELRRDIGELTRQLANLDLERPVLEIPPITNTAEGGNATVITGDGWKEQASQRGHYTAGDLSRLYEDHLDTIYEKLKGGKVTGAFQKENGRWVIPLDHEILP